MDQIHINKNNDNWIKFLQHFARYSKYFHWQPIIHSHQSHTGASDLRV